MPVEYAINSIPTDTDSQTKRGWDVSIDGERETEPISTLQLHHPKLGVTIDYGQRPEGYDGPVIQEKGGGGSVVVPYFINDGELYIGVVNESRPTMTDGSTEPIRNVPRGFMDPKEKHFDTATRILGQEAGFAPIADRVRELDGDPMNPNSAFFVTGKGKGVKAYGVEMTADELVESKVSNTPAQREYTFNTDIVKPTSKMGEKISGSTFIHWSEAVKLSDMFSVAATARIQPDLLSSEATKKATPEIQHKRRFRDKIKTIYNRMMGKV